MEKDQALDLSAGSRKTKSTFKNSRSAKLAKKLRKMKSREFCASRHLKNPIKFKLKNTTSWRATRDLRRWLKRKRTNFSAMPMQLSIWQSNVDGPWVLLSKLRMLELVVVVALYSRVRATSDLVIKLMMLMVISYLDSQMELLKRLHNPRKQTND